MDETTQQTDLTQLTVDLLSAFMTNNSVRADDIAGLISSTHAALAGLGSGSEASAPAEEHVGAVSARKSLSSKDHIISMIDGKPYKTLKRHLSRHDLTPDQYRERYKLPASYPMVAPSYSDVRRDAAKRIGLGNKGRNARAAGSGEANAGSASSSPTRKKASNTKAAPRRMSGKAALAKVRSDAPAES